MVLQRDQLHTYQNEFVKHEWVNDLMNNDYNIYICMYAMCI